MSRAGEPPEEHVVRMAREAGLGCYPVVVPESAGIPDPAVAACVYAATGGTLSPSPAFRAGARLTRSIRVTALAARWKDARDAADRFVGRLRQGGRMIACAGPVDGYDPDLELYQRSVTAEIAL